MNLKRGMILRHHSGRIYTVLNIIKTNEGGVNIVYYLGTDGKEWLRPLSEFKGKFSVISPS